MFLSDPLCYYPGMEGESVQVLLEDSRDGLTMEEERWMLIIINDGADRRGKIGSM